MAVDPRTVGIDPHTFKKLKSQAKSIAKAKGVKLKDAQSLLARDLGFSSWLEVSRLAGKWKPGASQGEFKTIKAGLMTHDYFSFADVPCVALGGRMGVTEASIDQVLEMGLSSFDFVLEVTPPVNQTRSGKLKDYNLKKMDDYYLVDLGENQKTDFYSLIASNEKRVHPAKMHFNLTLGEAINLNLDENVGFWSSSDIEQLYFKDNKGRRVWNGDVFIPSRGVPIENKKDLIVHFADPDKENIEYFIQPSTLETIASCEDILGAWFPGGFLGKATGASDEEIHELKSQGLYDPDDLDERRDPAYDFPSLENEDDYFEQMADLSKLRKRALEMQGECDEGQVYICRVLWRQNDEFAYRVRYLLLGLDHDYEMADINNFFSWPVQKRRDFLFQLVCRYDGALRAGFAESQWRNFKERLRPDLVAEIEAECITDGKRIASIFDRPRNRTKNNAFANYLGWTHVPNHVYETLERRDNINGERNPET